jgi:hypothetical protein
MFPDRAPRDLAYIPVTAAAAANLVRNEGAQCAIGHPDTARIVAGLLGMPECAEEWAAIAATRPNVVMGRGDSLIVAQYVGPRLPAGTTELPPGAAIEFWQVYDY